MRPNSAKHRRGLSLLESLMLVVILGITSGGVGQALIAVAKVPNAVDGTLSDEISLVSKMEFMRSVSFNNLTIGTAVSPYSDTVMVDIAYADPEGGSNPVAGWKQITVRLASGRQLSMMVSMP